MTDDFCCLHAEGRLACVCAAAHRAFNWTPSSWLDTIFVPSGQPQGSDCDKRPHGINAPVLPDKKLSKNLLQKVVSQLVDETFNCITVDSDTSTSDTLLVAATGQAEISPIVSSKSYSYRVFKNGLKKVMLDLCHQVVKDGEGATKFLEIVVSGGSRKRDSHNVALSIANSPLVKTAIAGEDPNWGRILAAVGRADVSDLDVSKIQISLNSVLIAEKGGRASSYTEAQGQQAMQAEDIEILIQLNRGQVSETLWTTDLSYEYVRINAEYRT